MKKRALSPDRQASSPLGHLEGELPTKLKDGEELPTLPVQQDKNLSDAQYQSISARFVTSWRTLINGANHVIATVVFYKCQLNDLDRLGLWEAFSNDTGLNPRRKRLLMRREIRPKSQ